MKKAVRLIRGMGGGGGGRGEEGGGGGGERERGEGGGGGQGDIAQTLRRGALACMAASGPWRHHWAYLQPKGTHVVLQVAVCIRSGNVGAGWRRKSALAQRSRGIRGGEPRGASGGKQLMAIYLMAR